MILGSEFKRLHPGVGQPARFGAGLHLALAALVLLACVFAPRPGRSVLLVPLGGSLARAEAEGPSGITRGWSLIGRGRIAGTWLVRSVGPVPVWTLLRRGILPLAVPDALCGADR